MSRRMASSSNSGVRRGGCSRGNAALDRNTGGTAKRNLMGYSIRDDRWRLTLWRDRSNQEIVARELYDEKNDPAETINLADKAEHREVLTRLSAHLPPPIGGASAK
jgi:hypothetical protein